MRDFEFFTFVSPDYFEPLARFPIGPRYRDLVRELVPPAWVVERFEVWLMARPAEYRSIDQGFKIHLSATSRTAEETLRRAVPECVRAGVAFKVAADPQLLWLTNSKNYHRGSSGKFLVAYPQTTQAFTDLIAALHRATAGLEAPYILSDRRYRDSKVVFYRYGSFLQIDRLSVDGQRTPCIRDPQGELVPDERLPYFKLPVWVEDPFPPDPPAAGGPDQLLNGRYRIESALVFSNAGGVYRAADERTGANVIIKEARPWTCFWTQDGEPGHIDSIEIRRKEFRLLQKLQGLGCVPEAVELFQEWEHLFLVEGFVDGQPLSRFRASDDFILIPYAHLKTRVERFCRGFRHVALELIRLVRRVHGRGVLINDLSPNNVMVDPETRALILIDLECALDLDEPDLVDAFVRNMFTPGFRRASRVGDRELGFEDDFFAVGMILYSLLMPIQSLFGLKPGAEDEFLTEIERFATLPPEVGEVIRSLSAGEAERAEATLRRWRPRAAVAAAWARRANREEDPWPARRAGLDGRIRRTLDGIGAHLLASYDLTRTDRLWPGDIESFRAHPLNLANGAGGPLLFLHDSGLGIPPPLIEWLRDRRPTRDDCPPGLFFGLAGIAQVLAEVGYSELATDALDEACRSPLAFAAPGYLYGAAGWGLVQLWFAAGGRSEALDRAREAGEHLLATAERRPRGLCWVHPPDEQVHFGLGYGASGVALFLLHLARATGEARYLRAAEEAIRFELASAANPRARRLRWPNSEQRLDVHEPYWRHGSAGIAAVLVRFASETGRARYLRAAEHAAAFAYCKFTVQPTQFEGLSGCGETVLDLYLATGEERYLRLAYEVAESILLYAVERPEGIIFPGRLLVRLSHDFGIGSAGVGLFLHRLLHPRPRRFHDLAPPAAASAVPVAAEGELAVPA